MELSTSNLIVGAGTVLAFAWTSIRLLPSVVRLIGEAQVLYLKYSLSREKLKRTVATARGKRQPKMYTVNASANKGA